MLNILNAVGPSGLDLNFMSDRAAAREVISATTPTTIVPIQTCAQVAITNHFLKRSWSCSQNCFSVIWSVHPAQDKGFGRVNSGETNCMFVSDLHVLSFHSNGRRQGWISSSNILAFEELMKSVNSTDILSFFRYLELYFGRILCRSRKMQLSSSCCAAKDAAADLADAGFGESARASGRGRCEQLERANFFQFWNSSCWVWAQICTGWPSSKALDAGFIPWDVVALLAAVRPHLFTRLGASCDVSCESRNWKSAAKVGILGGFISKVWERTLQWHNAHSTCWSYSWKYCACSDAWQPINGWIQATINIDLT